MDVQVGYLSTYYFNRGPDAGGLFPFAIDGQMDYVFEMRGIDFQDKLEVWLPIWMEQLDGFPLYFCVETRKLHGMEIEERCNQFYLPCTYLLNNKRKVIAVIEVKNSGQLRGIFPLLVSKASWNDVTVLWSSNKNVFTIEEREWTGNLDGKREEAIVAAMGYDTTVFWIGYDTDWLSVISNERKFSTFEGICQTLPVQINAIIDESSWNDD